MAERALLRVLQVNKLYHPVIGGIEEVVQAIAEGLRERTDMNVVVCNTTPRTVHEIVNGVRVTRAASFGRFLSLPLSLSFFREFRRAARNVDVVQLHAPFPIGDLAIALFRPRAGLVVWWHSDIVRQRILGALQRPLVRWVLRRADRIVGATPNHISSSNVLPQFADKAVVIPYGVDLRRFERTPGDEVDIARIRAKYASRPLVLFVGRLVYYKGVDVLVRAAAHAETNIVIIGDGPLRLDLERLAKDLGIDDRVFFAGRVPDDELAPYFHACDFLVLPSVARSEAFGLVQLEAMACGKPVINSRLDSGVPWVSLDGETGFSVPPGDSDALASAMRRLIDEPTLRARFGAAARQRVESQFEMNRMLEATLALYAEVAAEASSR